MALLTLECEMCIGTGVNFAPFLQKSAVNSGEFFIFETGNLTFDDVTEKIQQFHDLGKDQFFLIANTDDWADFSLNNRYQMQGTTATEFLFSAGLKLISDMPRGKIALIAGVAHSPGVANATEGLTPEGDVIQSEQ